MKKHREWFFGVGLTLLALVVLLLWMKAVPRKAEEKAVSAQMPSDKPETSPKGEEAKAALKSPVRLSERAQRNEEGLTNAFETPIDFYGVVLDQHDQPVSGAQVDYSVVSTFDLLDSKQQSGDASGPDGRFSIVGNQGASIYVKVSHPDYRFSPYAQQTFSFYQNPKAVRKEALPAESHPAVFRLIKKGEAEPLLKLKQVLRNVPKDGHAVRVGLTGEKSDDVTVCAWTEVV